MAESKLYRARVQMVKAMEQGLPWDEAAKQAELQISQSTAYRLRQRMRQGGKQALQEGRHGHPAKLRGEVREWLEETCRQAPYTPSHEIQAQLAERFALCWLLSLAVPKRAGMMALPALFLSTLRSSEVV